MAVCAIPLEETTVKVESAFMKSVYSWLGRAGAGWFDICGSLSLGLFCLAGAGDEDLLWGGLGWRISLAGVG